MSLSLGTAQTAREISAANSKDLLVLALLMRVLIPLRLDVTNFSVDWRLFRSVLRQGHLVGLQGHSFISVGLILNR